jgi:creatinine amidohydrolase
MSNDVPSPDPSAAVSQALRRWADLTTHDAAALDPARTVAVLPVAATEQHGPHLPLSVDTDLLEGILAAAGAFLEADRPVYVLPTQAVGLSPEHAHFAGTLTLRPETAIRLWVDIGASVARSGVRKLLLFNSHGGHVGLMDVVGRELRAQHGLIVYSCSWFQLPLLDAQGQDVHARIAAHEQRFGIHAGQVETSMMLALRPACVRMAQAQSFPSTSAQRARQWPILGNGRSAKLAWLIQDYHPAGAVGNAAAADAALGHDLVQAAGRALATLLHELVALPLDTLHPGTRFP